MKSLLKIIFRYSVTAGAIIFAVLIFNMSVFIYWGYKTVDSSKNTQFSRNSLEEVGRELYQKDGRWEITGQGIEKMKDMGYQWSMALDGRGTVVWEWRLPDNFARSYSLKDVAAFTRWYLHDYPVAVWQSGDLLLVVGLDKETYVRFSELFPLSNIEGIPGYLSLAFTVNAVLILFLVLLLGYRFYRALKPIGKGIERLSRQEDVNLKVKGMAEDLAGQLNKASSVLQKQKEMLSKRDQARTEWISGVSHDIRTPLALILGYSDRLKKEENLSGDAKRSAEIICRQSLIIRQLIDDLNLTSKLAYQAQPLKKSLCSPAQILRECAADIYNEDIPEEKSAETEMELLISPDAEQIRILADSGLLKRALRNLIGNSIRHNPQGCMVGIRLSRSGSQVRWKISDTGRGIPETVVQNMDTQTEKVHIMGLRLARQIARAHGGDLVFCRRETGSYDVEMVLPDREN